MDGDVAERMVSSRFTIRVGMPFGVRVYPEGEVASVYEGLVVVAPVGGAILFLVGSSSLWFHCSIVANLGAYATRPSTTTIPFAFISPCRSLRRTFAKPSFKQ